MSFNPKRLRRYHYKVWFPTDLCDMVKEFVTQLDGKEIGFTHHADKERLNDKRGIIPKVNKQDLLNNDNKIVEVYEILTNNGRRTNTIQKLVIRIVNIDDKYDYVFVLAREGFVVSCWINSKSDIHRITSSFSNYYCPPEIRKEVKNKIVEQEKNFIKEDSL